MCTPVAHHPITAPPLPPTSHTLSLLCASVFSPERPAEIHTQVVILCDTVKQMLYPLKLVVPFRAEERREDERRWEMPVTAAL